MENKDKKCHVIMVSRFFPATHPRKGEKTNFMNSIFMGTKVHTIRGNCDPEKDSYELWRKRIAEVNEGKAYLSLRYWAGKPYNSKQVEFKQIHKAAVSHFKMVDTGVFIDWQIDCDKPMHTMEELAANDGLSKEDFLNWFFPQNQKVVRTFEGAIIWLNK